MLLSLFSFKTMIFAEPIEITDTWSLVNTFGDHYIMQVLDVDVPVDTANWSIHIAPSNYVVLADGGYDSEISFFVGVTEYTATLAEISGTSEIEYDYFVDFTDFNGDDITGATSFNMNIALNFTSAPSGWTDYFNDNTFMAFDVEPLTVRFYNRLALYYEYDLYTIEHFPTDPTPPSGKKFVGWETITGEVYNEGLPESDWISQDGIFRLYATYQDVLDVPFETDDPSVTTPSALATVLTGLGLYNSAGFMIIYALLLIILALGIVLLKVSAFIMIILDILITALFWYFGMLPLFVSILMIFVFMISILLVLNGGKQYE